MNIIEQNESVIKELADKIANKTKYPEVKILYSDAYSFIKDYMKASLLLKQHYAGTTSQEAQQLLGNIFTKIVYLNQKGLVSDKDVTKDNFDVALRDKIWVTLSLIREYALQSPRYNPIWKPYAYVQEAPTPQPSQSDSIPTIEPVQPSRSDSIPTIQPAQTADNKWLWAIGAGALLLLMI